VTDLLIVLAAVAASIAMLLFRGVRVVPQAIDGTGSGLGRHHRALGSWRLWYAHLVTVASRRAACATRQCRSRSSPW
jgi:regulator of protease activity HflC (stomatin/prohibitin superfamily)